MLTDTQDAPGHAGRVADDSRPADVITTQVITAEVITAELVAADLSAGDRVTVLRRLAELLHAAGRVSEMDAFLADVGAREEILATGLPGGVALPHLRSASVSRPAVAIGRVPAGVDWGAPDGPATLIFLIAAPDDGGAAHLALLRALTHVLVDASVRQALMAAPDAAAITRLLLPEVSDR